GVMQAPAGSWATMEPTQQKLLPSQTPPPMLHLSARWAPYLKSQPETGMGYQYVSVFLRDGRRFDRVAVVGGTIASIDGSPNIPFSEDQITDIQVTHDRPDKRRG